MIRFLLQRDIDRVNRLITNQTTKHSNSLLDFIAHPTKGVTHELPKNPHSA